MNCTHGHMATQTSSSSNITIGISGVYIIIVYCNQDVPTGAAAAVLWPVFICPSIKCY